jgi:hypothetical protein
VEYLLILFLAVTLFGIVARTLRPVLTRLAKKQSEQMEKQFSRGLYQFRFPSR